MTGNVSGTAGHEKLRRIADVNEDKKRQAKSEFIISKYLWDQAKSQFRCQKPKSLPCGCDGRECRIVVHEWRHRKTGPEHRLMVVYCKTHGTYFTIYPPGYVPYGRIAVTPVNDEKTWSGTIFGSAMDETWRSAYRYTGGMCWQSHRRCVEKCGHLLGLSGEFTVCENAAAILDVPLHVQVSARTRFAAAGLDGQVDAVRSVLTAITVSPRLWRQMMRLGWETGVGGRAWEWSADERLVPLFPIPEREVLKPACQATGSDP